MDDPQFDAEFYAAWYADLAHLNQDELADHWRDHGRSAGRFGTFQAMLQSVDLDEKDVPTDFHWSTYLGLNPDIPRSWDRWRVTRHYLEYGQHEGREYWESPTAARNRGEVDAILHLDEDWYADVYGLSSDADVAEHYERAGRANLLAPNPSFSPLGYWEANPDVARRLIDPVTHYRASGHLVQRPTKHVDVDHERRRTVFRPAALAAAREFFAFDRDFYYGQRQDIARARHKIDAEEHYHAFGEKEGAKPSAHFDPRYYRKKHESALQAWSGPALDHFLSLGILQGLMPSAEIAQGANRIKAHSVTGWLEHWTGRPVFAPLPRAAGSGPTPLARREPVRPPESVSAERRVLNWVIPAFSKGGGGHTTIFRTARTLARQGWRSVFWIANPTSTSEIDGQYAEYIGHFPTTAVEFRRIEDGLERVSGEFLVASSWETAYLVAANPNPNARVYFVQDRESLFDPAGTRSLQAEWTYHLGFDYVCAGPWLEDHVASTGGDHMSFELCAGPAFAQEDPPLAERDVLAAIYVRGHSPRRATDLMVHVANRLADTQLGEVVVFGDENPPFALSPQVVNAGVLSQEEMATLFQRSRFGLAASATNYSILPVELAAAGTVVVQPWSGSTQDTTDARGAYSVEPTADAMVDFVVEQATGLTQHTFDLLRGGYTDFARSLSWETELEKVGTWLESKLRSTGSGPAGSPALVTRQKAAVIIPTYYPREQFLEVVEQVHDQLSSFDIVLQIVDTRRDGKISPVIDKVQSEGFARVHPIDPSEFQHGATRNLGARLVPDADYYAFLTDDATPADEYWLESLVAPMAMLPDCAYTFGRHRAYPGHHPLYDRELTNHFSGFRAHGYIASRRSFPRRFDSEPWFRAALSFNSDNNAGYRGDILRRYGFPEVPFAEDQAFAHQLLIKGYSRAYCPSSVVVHSHDYTDNPEGAFKRGTEEADALYQNFGLVQFTTAQDALRAKRHTERAVVNNAIRLGLRAEETDSFLRAKHAYIDGARSAGTKYLRGR